MDRYPHDRSRRALGIGLVLLGTWAAFWVWSGRQAMLDDALIHLRYAENLWLTGMFSYDANTPTYGTSSPFFVILLAVFTLVGAGVAMPKAISTFLMLVLLALATWKVVTTRAATWLVLLIVLASPMGFRWLADGMETSAAALLAVLIAAQGFWNPGKARSALLVGAVCFSAGLVAVTTRIELGLGIGALGLVSFVLGDWRQARRSWLPLALGGAAGYALLGATFGHIVPDTAIAKAFGPMSLGEAVLVALFSSATAFSFGIGLMLLWCASFVALLRTASVNWRVATLIVNSLLPILVLFVAVRGQAVQGVRHLLWAYALAITWNMLALERRHGAERGEFAPLQGRVQRRILAGLAIGVAAVWAVEVPLTLRILAARRGVLQGMREARLERLAGMTGAAFDVGYVGYLSKAQILDLSGLVNGREVASMSSKARLERVALRRPQFLFLTSEQVERVGAALDVTQYVVVRSFRSRRVSSDERYALAVLRPLAPAIGSDCAEEQPTLAEFASAGGAIPCLGNH